MRNKKISKSLNLYLGSEDEIPSHKIFHGDVYACLQKINNNSVNCAVTSPPYWNQRDYDFPDQIGNEQTQEDYLSKLVTIFSLLREKLVDKGIFFLNIGDKYINKYGNTPLGMIPYKLAYYLVKNGWILEDTIIWYKTNHMPSSVKNRFTNTYEPVFVFAKSETNYYKEYRKQEKSKNIEKISLQQVSYSHMATYPEKLVEILIRKLKMPKESLIIDPFAGSGTTAKAVLNINNQSNCKYHSLMIEANENYVNIIQDRCRIRKEDITKITSIKYEIKKLKKAEYKSQDINGEKLVPNYQTDLLYIKFLKDSSEFNRMFCYLLDEEFINSIDDEGVLFIGLQDHSVDRIYFIASLNDWIIRNMLIVPNKNQNDWFPVLMLVKDIKSIKYRFNIDAIRVSHTFESRESWGDINFIGFKVIRSGSFFKKTKNGLIAKILSFRGDKLPEWVIVKWEDNSYSLEEVINPPIPRRNVSFYCPKCMEKLDKYHHNRKEISCFNCSTILWKSTEGIPILTTDKRIEPDVKLYSIDISVKEKGTKKNYEGKFIDSSRINMGQSPGARASVSELFFTVQRYYKVKQSLICDYLNIHRKKKKLSKKVLTEKFPPEYKHTVGHWIRKDMGGSLPKVEDVNILTKMLDLDNSYINYVNRMGIKLQTVTANKKGKNPGDFLELTKEELIQMLKKGTEEELSVSEEQMVKQ
ncbi:MAG: DNA-methyltransferase [Candidatus Hodarchaeales archaeon]